MRAYNLDNTKVLNGKDRLTFGCNPIDSRICQPNLKYRTPVKPTMYNVGDIRIDRIENYKKYDIVDESWLAYITSFEESETNPQDTIVNEIFIVDANSQFIEVLNKGVCENNGVTWEEYLLVIHPNSLLLVGQKEKPYYLYFTENKVQRYTKTNGDFMFKKMYDLNNLTRLIDMKVNTPKSL